MENLDALVFRTLRDWRLKEKHALLVTVVRTWGSSPRPTGSIMAICEDGSVVGSVSGGCIEDDLIDRYAGASNKKGDPSFLGSATLPTFLKYGVTADEAHRFGLPCGGTLELLIECDPDVKRLQELVQLLEDGHLVRRTVSLHDGQVSLERSDSPEELMFSAASVVNTFGPAFRMLLIGAGQLTEYLATMATFSGFAVTVCDPRQEYRGSWSVPGVDLVADMPDDVVLAFHADRRTCIIALTHDPKLDDLALLEAIKTEAFYVGAIGSRRNNDSRRQRLIAHFDQTDESLRRLRGPIGIYIGSKTPPEIAVSVMAEILAVKNGVRLPRDMDVAKAKSTLAIPSDVTEAACARDGLQNPVTVRDVHMMTP